MVGAHVSTFSERLREYHLQMQNKVSIIGVVSMMLADWRTVFGVGASSLLSLPK